MTPFDLVGLVPLLRRTSGRAEVAIGLVDGPVTLAHADLAGTPLRVIGGAVPAACAAPGGDACRHGTFVAGLLGARPEAPTPSICPGCTLLIRPVFADRADAGPDGTPGTTAGELAAAIRDCVRAGARCINLSLALVRPHAAAAPVLEQALDLALRRGVLVVAAAGNQATLGGTALSRHPWVIPVVGCDLRGRPTAESNLGHSIGRRGLRAPGIPLPGLGASGEPVTLGGTSVAAPFVTGAAALLWSAFPDAAATEVRAALVGTGAPGRPRRAGVVPPLLDAWSAYLALESARSRRPSHAAS
jgi:subtilisin family serine protease